ncbi:MAG: aminopeptidase P family protein [Candidatus Kapabacteria bacterium]|nr:aminopeptidase P family protein [Candidatus Kapabacteria bacterium]
MKIEEIQKALKELKLDGWLFYDFHRRDPIAQKILSIDSNKIFTRRWFYFIPSDGIPKKLVHSIEPYNLDHLPGEKFVYLAWQKLHNLLKEILGDSKKIAMQYSKNNMIPYICVVDGGTLELIRSFGIEVASSGELVSLFESHLTDEDIESHKQAVSVLYQVKDFAFSEISKRIKNNESCNEFIIQQLMQDKFRENNMIWDMGPIVSVNANNADPHYIPTPEIYSEIKLGDTVMIDLWAKKNQPGSIYADITWMAYVGDNVPENLENIFQITCKARDAALSLLKARFNNSLSVQGWEVDDACRSIINQAGFENNFFHRTGHNIGEEVHGPGVHMDNLETKDERNIIKGSCFSIEPGIYLKGFNGFRTEIDVIITNLGQVEVAGEIQNKIIPLL